MDNGTRVPELQGYASNETLSYGSVQAGLLIPVSFFIVAGNFVTILAVYRTPSLRTVPNMYIVSLSVADILAGLSTFYASLSLIPQLTETFDAEKYRCLSRYILVYTSLSASVANLAAVAVDRYLYILRPFQYEVNMTPGKACVVIAMTWMFAFVWGTVPLYANTWESGKRCLMFHVLSVEYQVCLVGVLFGFGSIVFLTCYGSIARVAKKQMREICNTTVFARDSNHRTESCTHKDWKIIRMLFTVFGVFFACWLPSVLGVLAATRVTVSETYMGFAITIGMLNSGMNVFIYAMKNREFKNAFAEILCKLCFNLKSRRV